MTFYELLPEWAPQSGVMLTWPHSKNTWYPSLAEVEKSFVLIAKEVAKREKLLINCIDEACRDHVHELLQTALIDLSRVQLMVVPSNDVWARDHGPLTVMDAGQLKLLDFSFNGWGNKYPCDQDNLITQNLKKLGVFNTIPIEVIPYVLEGGSVEVDGKGTLLTTRSCLLADTRNPAIDSVTLEQNLKHWLGLKRILWLDHGHLEGDDTDGHIDTLARFTDPATIAYVSCDDPEDEHYPALKLMADELRAFKNYRGEPYRLVALPWPKAKYGPDGRRLPATYANFLIINGAVLVPTYDDLADNTALHLVQSCFPDREVIGVPCRHVIEQYGSLHCVTMQLPKGVLS